jgi:hypothetical protein
MDFNKIIGRNKQITIGEDSFMSKFIYLSNDNF